MNLKKKVNHEILPVRTTNHVRQPKVLQEIQLHPENRFKLLELVLQRRQFPPEPLQYQT